ncbi:prolyl oligopeptidase family serine peptidase [Aestuariimicrobium sp. p3-SID1156]|uniref:alpha/beta hydrolase family protein n=1 Tax=Aestuariimicrobium sp. p3-SID1156 TaxID=2916038 RepID=UPI00223A8EAA|nr:prolyl oligopeptidase family serine peptidase [Aestuariimicrobium sp. p3-SID1156]MCT1459925.1 prolyl oligopeptidase family serine peptidase [Aestuariimicrobium sp. p3-SID1156]
MTEMPYGSWPGTTPADEVLRGSVSLQEVQTSDGGVFWSESRPTENGRSTVMHRAHNGGVFEDAEQFDVRSRVMEYGGGAWSVDDATLALVDDRRRQVQVGGWTRPFVPLSSATDQVAYGDLRLHTRRGLLLAIQEDHRGEGEAVTRIVAFRLDRGEQEPIVLVEGASFYADPELSEDGRLAWCEWDHPNMPWDSTRIKVADMDLDALGISEPTIVAEGWSGLHPRWAGGELVYVDDPHGFWNFYAWNAEEGSRSLTTTRHDHEMPLWTLGNNHWALFPRSRPEFVVGMRLVDGRLELVRAPLSGEGEIELASDPHLRSMASVQSMAADDHAVYLIMSFTDRPDELIMLDPLTGRAEPVHGSGRPPAPGTVSIPENLWVDGPHGRVQAFFYPPQHPEITGPEGERPPLVVLSHGGPTSMALPGLNSKVQYWTSRGFAVVDVNYGGSSGFGRQYRERLRGNWGIVDVDDCRAVVEHLVREGRVDPRRVAITGGSAGGYTTLQSLVTTDTYTAGVSRYGIGDLATLATDTHKFEARYPDGLVGPWPEAADLYAERSPIKHVDKLATPMLILQGTDDKVVPPNQAESMAAAVKEAGQPVALVMFEGEGHGFRRMDSRRHALLAEQAFYCKLWGLDSPDDLPDLDWL